MGSLLGRRWSHGASLLCCTTMKSDVAGSGHRFLMWGPAAFHIIIGVGLQEPFDALRSGKDLSQRPCPRREGCLGSLLAFYKSLPRAVVLGSMTAPLPSQMWSPPPTANDWAAAPALTPGDLATSNGFPGFREKGLKTEKNGMRKWCLRSGYQETCSWSPERADSWQQGCEPRGSCPGPSGPRVMPPEESRVANLPGVCVRLDDRDLTLSPVSSATCFTLPPPPASAPSSISSGWS